MKYWRIHGLAAFLLCALVVGCKKTSPDRVRLELSGTNSGTISGKYVVDGVSFTLPELTETNINLAGKSVRFWFTNTAKTGEIVVNVWVNDNRSSSGVSASTIAGSAP